MKDENYINIQGFMINRLGLKGNELIIYAIIYGFSQDGKSEYRGSLSYMENALKVSRHTIIRAINSLEEKNLITKTRKSTGNLYSANIALVSKLHCTSAKTALPSSAKTAHNNNNTNNKYNNTSNKLQVNSLIKEFESLDLKNKRYYGNKTQREACQFLIDHYGYEVVVKLIRVLPKFNSDKFLPRIKTPYEMVEKWTKLEDYFKSKKREQTEVKSNFIT